MICLIYIQKEPGIFQFLLWAMLQSLNKSDKLDAQLEMLNPYERSDVRVISCLSISYVILYNIAIYICDSFFMPVSKLPTLIRYSFVYICMSEEKNTY
jgi:hypothetical protein